MRFQACLSAVGGVPAQRRLQRWSLGGGLVGCGGGPPWCPAALAGMRPLPACSSTVFQPRGLHSDSCWHAFVTLSALRPQTLGEMGGWVLRGSCRSTLAVFHPLVSSFAGMGWELRSLTLLSECLLTSSSHTLIRRDCSAVRRSSGSCTASATGSTRAAGATAPATLHGHKCGASRPWPTAAACSVRSRTLPSALTCMATSSTEQSPN